VSVFTLQRSTPQEARLIAVGEADDGMAKSHAVDAPVNKALPLREVGAGGAPSCLCDEEGRSQDPEEPQDTMIGHRPGVVLVPTFHVHEIRAPRFG
jgi:hypothetical protein